MVKIENQVIKHLTQSLNKDCVKYHISRSIINTIDFRFLEIESEVIIENCIIDTFSINSCWFLEGLSLKNNIIKNDIDYQMGGHNKKLVNIEANIFHGFVNFFDCHFEEIIYVKDNVFLKGTNLLGNSDVGYKNLFDKEIILKNNIGKLDINN